MPSTMTHSDVERVDAEDLRSEYERGALILDVRTHEQRRRDGAIPGAHAVEIDELEVRLSRTGKDRMFWVPPLQRVVLVGDDGRESQWAAARLRDLGQPHATDVAGGFQAWKRTVATR